MKTTVTELEGSKVRVEVEVEPSEVQGNLDRSARELGREIRIPGFRSGKVPPAIVLQRIGRQEVLERSVRASLPEWYERAILDSGVRPIGDPKLELDDLPDEGETLNFTVEVAVRPRATLGEYRGVEAGRREPEVPEGALEEELDRLRESFGSLETVERPAEEGDFLLVDFEGSVEGEPFEGGQARDYLLELGGGALLEGFEEQLQGAVAGEERQVKVSFPKDYRSGDVAGREADFAVSVKEVKEKRLPELTDDFAADASEFDTLDELRAEIDGRILEALGQEAEGEFRQAVVDAVVDAAEIVVPDEVVSARAEESWDQLAHSLSHRGVEPERYLEISGKTREQVIEEAKSDAEQALRREAVLAAVADAEAIEVSDDELLEQLAATAERQKAKPEKLLRRLRESGRDAPLRDDLRMRKALDVLVSEARPIPLQQAKARDALWTPEKEDPGKSAGGIWTPGDPR